MNRRSFIEGFCTLFGISLLSRCRSNDPQPPDTTFELRKSPNAEDPSKVVHVMHPKATAWDYQSGRYIDSLNREIVYSMISEGLMLLTGAKSLKAAWTKLLKAYRPDHQIVIKPNLNNSEIGYTEAIMTSPQVVYGVVRSLIEAGISPDNITLYDLTAKAMPEIEQAIEPFGIQTVWRREPSSFFDKLALKLETGLDAPDTNAMIKMRKPVLSEAGTPIACYLPKVVTKAHHIINLPVLKAHQFILQSNAFKNHFGTVRYSSHHQYPVLLHGPHIESHIVDINSHPIIRQRTRLVLVDALFGAPLFTRGENGRTPTRWQTFLHGSTPNSLLFSTDPLAAESISADFILAEQNQAGVKPHSLAYLQDARKQGLGKYEHRDKNGRYKEIEYVLTKLPKPTRG